MRYQQETRGQNFFAVDPNLKTLLARRAPDLLARNGERLHAFGAWIGSDVDCEAEYTDRFAPPVLEGHDRFGRLTNRVRHNPLYAEIHRDVYARGIVGLNFGPKAEPFLMSFLMGYLLSQADISIHCPATLTGAVAYILGKLPEKAAAKHYLEGLLRLDGKALTGGTWATELDGGSDLAATATVAKRDGEHFRLTGFKWFASNPDSDVALATARPEEAPGGTEGLGLYLVPKALADGSPNRYRIRRLKTKLGTRGLASGEIELEGAFAFEVSPPPRGLRLMLEALDYSRVHNAFAAAAVGRRAFLEAIAYASHRQAFGKILLAFPMVQSVLLDLQMNAEASLALAFEAAVAFDESEKNAKRLPWRRLTTALAKYWTAEKAIRAASSAIEVLGGVGYTEDYVTPRLLRDAQVLTVWEGTANIQALEVLRLVAGNGEGFGAFVARIEGVLGGVKAPLEEECAKPLRSALALCADGVRQATKSPEVASRIARRLMNRMAVLLAACLLLEEAAADLAEKKDGRKACLAKRFIRRTLDFDAASQLLDTEPLSQRDFERVVGYEEMPA